MNLTLGSNNRDQSVHTQLQSLTQKGNPDIMRHPIKNRLLLGILGSLLLQGCSTAISVPIKGYNHTSETITHFSVSGVGDLDLSPYGDSKETCCTQIPARWYRGVTVLVEWETAVPPQDYATWPEPPLSEAWSQRMKDHQLKFTRHRATAYLVPYAHPSGIGVHFLPCNKVAVSGDTHTPGQPGGIRAPRNPVHLAQACAKP
jgi:hypothetical protein